jgi:hypothetical protein
MFGLDQDFSAFYRRAEQAAPGLEAGAAGVLRSPTFFEDVLKTILTTNTLWEATKRMNPESHRHIWDGGRWERVRAFPDPSGWRRPVQAVLRRGPRQVPAPAIHELAHRPPGKLDIEGVQTSSLPTLELRKGTAQDRGVGPCAAANLLMILGARTSSRSTHAR